MTQTPVTAEPPQVDLGAGVTWAALGVWTGVWSVVHAWKVAGSWHYLVQGAHLLLGGGPGGGLHLYASHPELQIGPLSFLVAAPLAPLPALVGRLLAAALMTVAGLLVLRVVFDLVPAGGRSCRRLLLAGLPFIAVWTELSVSVGHLDDVLAVVLGTVALRAIQHERWVLAAVLVAAAADAKPWAAAFVAVIFVVPVAQRLRALLTWAAAVGAAWLPFVLADPRTLAAAHFGIPNAASSALRVLGVGAATTPSWDRPTQIVLGAALAAVAVARGRWTAALAVAMAVRVMLDPSVYGYYTAGLLVGTVAFDLIHTRWRVPWMTLAGATLLYLPGITARGEDGADAAPGLGVVRAAYCIAVIAVVLFWPGVVREPSTAGDDVADGAALTASVPRRSP